MADEANVPEVDQEQEINIEEAEPPIVGADLSDDFDLGNVLRKEIEKSGTIKNKEEEKPQEVLQDNSVPKEQDHSQLFNEFGVKDAEELRTGITNAVNSANAWKQEADRLRNEALAWKAIVEQGRQTAVSQPPAQQPKETEKGFEPFMLPEGVSFDDLDPSAKSIVLEINRLRKENYDLSHKTREYDNIVRDKETQRLIADYSQKSNAAIRETGLNEKAVAVLNLLQVGANAIAEKIPEFKQMSPKIAAQMLQAIQPEMTAEYIKTKHPGIYQAIAIEALKNQEQVKKETVGNAVLGKSAPVNNKLKTNDNNKPIPKNASLDTRSIFAQAKDAIEAMFKSA